MPDPIPCRHIHIEGRRCGSPALRGQKLCYHHTAALRPLARRSGDPLGPLLPDPEDLPAVQRGLAELLRLVARNLIDAKQAKLLFALLTEAGANLARIDRAHARRRHLALSEARFAAKYPEAAAKLAAENAPDCVIDLVHDPELGPIAPAPGTASTSELSDTPSSESMDESPAPNLLPDLLPDLFPDLYPDQLPDLLPAFARDSPGDEHARTLRDQAAAAEQAEFERREEENREQRRALRLAALECERNRSLSLDRERQNRETTGPLPPDPPVTPLEC